MWLMIAEKPMTSVLFAPSKTKEVLVAVFISDFEVKYLDQVQEPLVGHTDRAKKASKTVEALINTFQQVSLGSSNDILLRAEGKQM